MLFKYLRRHRHVKSFEYAPQSAGGSGCTIYNLRVKIDKKD
ncbi:MAG: Smr/MutS family protein [Streptococcus salivarius]